MDQPTANYMLITELMRGATSLVEVVKSTRDLGGVESCVFLRQPTMSLHVKHEVATINTFYYKEQPAVDEGGGRRGEGGREEVGENMVALSVYIHVVV